MGSYRSFGMFGLILLLFGILAGLASGIWNSMYVLIHLIGGASMLALYLFTHVESLRESVSGRRAQYATNTFVYTALTLAVIVLVNYMGARNEYRYDASEQGIFSIAPQTISLLAGLADEIHVLAFFRENEGRAAESLLDAYVAESDRFSYEMIDPDQRPEMAQQHEVTQYSTLVVVYGDDSTRVAGSDRFMFLSSESPLPPSPRSVRLASSSSSISWTSPISRILIVPQDVSVAPSIRGAKRIFGGLMSRCTRPSG